MKILKCYENFESLINFRILKCIEIFEILKFFSLIDDEVKSVPNKYKTFIQSGRGTKNPRKRFTLPVHSLKNYGPLNSQTTGKREK
jgi:hypothetical protein